MSTEPASLPNALRPDRVLGRTCAHVLTATLIVLLAGHALGTWRAERNAQMSAQVAAATEQVAGARSIASQLGRLDALESGAERRIAEAVIAQNLLRLAERERMRPTRIAGLARSLPASRSEADRAAVLMGAQKMAAADQPLSAEELVRLRAVFESTIVPELENSARLLGREAERVARVGRLVFWIGSLAQVLGIVAVWFGLLRPAVARTRTWMQATAEIEDDVRRRLLHDPVTDLPNVTYLNRFLARLVAEATRRPTDAAVLQIDVARFEGLRDLLGQRTATEIVRIAARRIQQCLRPGDFAAHLGQDRFAVVATGLSDPSDAAGLAQRVHAALNRPFALAGGARRIGCSMGVALLSDDVPDAERVLANSEIALGQARQAGSGGIRYFCERMRSEVEEREMLCAEILGGIERGEFVPYFQPQIRLATGELVGFEALARWNHPERGVLAPRDFLEVAEQADLIEQLGEAILTGVLDALRRWDMTGLHVPCVGVNFALAQLHDGSLIERIKWEADQRDIEPARLAIEVLETVLIKSDADQVARNLRGLASVGFRIDLDDFGTGHASISNLRRFMASRIKIDRSFVRGIDTREDQHKLIASIIAMARALDVRTLAEGVETAAEEAVLRAIGCDEVQGYRIGRPMPETAATAWLERRRTGAPTLLPDLPDDLISP